MAMRVLTGASWLIPTKLQKVSNCTANNSAGPKRRAKRASKGARKVISSVANMAPTKDEVKAAVSACAAWPRWAMG